jgi:hypothetical protein
VAARAQKIIIGKIYEKIRIQEFVDNFASLCHCFADANTEYFYYLTCILFVC